MDNGRRDRFLRACRRQRVDRTPVWFMRQAGRYLPSYRKLREKHDILSICKDPELAARVTLMPVKELGVDAAIIFSDIMLLVEAMGVSLRMEEGVGPLITKPIKYASEIKQLRSVDPQSDLDYVLNAITLTRKLLRGEVPLIGFSGAPFTLASYMIEGGATRDFLKTKKMMYSMTHSWHLFMEKLSEAVLKYLRAQIEAGAQAVQLFDSWVGCLSPGDYKEFVQPYSSQILEGLKSLSIPRIHFGTSTAALLELMSEVGGDVIGVDWRVNIDDAWELIGEGMGIQGNLDPVSMLGPYKLAEAKANDILMRVNGRQGHIFNLGHGILPKTPVGNVSKLVEYVHTWN